MRMQKAMFNANISEFRVRSKGNSEEKAPGRREREDIEERLRYCASEERQCFLISNTEDRECQRLYFDWLCI